MKETNEIKESSLTTISAVITMNIITFIGARIMLSSEPQIHESPFIDVVKNIVAFDVVTVILLLIFKTILIKVGVIVLMVSLILALLGALAAPILPFLVWTLPLIGFIALIIFGILCWISTSTFAKELFAELTSCIEPTVNKVFGKCLAILVAVNIFGAPIIYHLFTEQ